MSEQKTFKTVREYRTMDEAVKYIQLNRENIVDYSIETKPAVVVLTATVLV